ncbi:MULTISPECIES: hypothetical protein [unclassified Pseudofrankia]|uniref:hypothetical protein n=1 Tax=unclassified Pseudofrankia TaxID=2994372 RepID=UPI0008D95943|nr:MULTISPECIES: hypothetical protein [unclassified Pseudofrankia]MDT3439349.1 hypothetical protein [Pseudofrankia sp. BMG5.37]OHV53757.1 hypothetical protein BCD48_44660 [Pseudofrankia sp. BMG5.36]
MVEVREFGEGSRLRFWMRFSGRPVRIGSAPDSEWVLVDGTPEPAAGGYGHGSVRLWAPDGSLAGVGSQTAALRFPRG